MSTKLTGVVFAMAALIGCASNKAPDVAAKIRTSLDDAGLKSVSVSQDRDKGVVTLGGNVAVDQDKERAAQIAQPLAAGEVVANQIAVLPEGGASIAKSVDSDLDKGIEANLDAALTAAQIKGVDHSTKNGVVTLTGSVNTPALRAQAERTASGVPNVQQVVNKLDVKNQRATSSADRSR